MLISASNYNRGSRIRSSNSDTKKAFAPAVKKMKLRHAAIPIEYICKLLGRTEQTYYYNIRYQTKILANEPLLISKIMSIRADIPGIGVPKLRHMLLIQADYKLICPGRAKLYELMRKHSMLLIRKVKRGTTTDSRHRYKLYPNLIKGLNIDRPNQL